MVDLKDLVCGKSLRHGVVWAGISALVVSAIVFVTALVVVARLSTTDVRYHKQPLVALDLLLGLASVCISIYQMIISSLMLWQVTKPRPNIFLISVWYISQMSILSMYLIFVCARMVVCFKEKRYILGAATIIVGIIYEVWMAVSYTIILSSFWTRLKEQTDARNV